MKMTWVHIKRHVLIKHDASPFNAELAKYFKDRKRKMCIRDRGNDTLLDWLNEEIISLGEEQFFHSAYKATLADTYGLDYEDSLVVEGGRKNK